MYRVGITSSAPRCKKIIRRTFQTRGALFFLGYERIWPTTEKVLCCLYFNGRLCDSCSFKKNRIYWGIRGNPRLAWQAFFHSFGLLKNGCLFKVWCLSKTPSRWSFENSLFLLCELFQSSSRSSVITTVKQTNSSRWTLRSRPHRDPLRKKLLDQSRINNWFFSLPLLSSWMLCLDGRNFGYEGHLSAAAADW